ncbi:MAG TPA: FtsX-like permease family protein [Tepidisphaeraceae bacterium]|nr:FtsX-like permease family protein [Tepidisphaeraceae bacterium]
MAVSKITWSSVVSRKARLVLTVLAIGLSVSLVIAVTSGYASAEAAVARFFTEFMGSTDIKVSREPGQQGNIRESIVEGLARDRDVKMAVGRLELDTNIVDINGKPIPGHELQTATLIGVRLPHDADVAALKMEKGLGGKWFEEDSGDFAVIDQEASRLLGAKPGDFILLPAQPAPLKLKVTGVVHKPAIIAALQQTIYVPLRTLQRLRKLEGQVTSVQIDLKEDVDADAFARRWKQMMVEHKPPLKMSTARESRKELDKYMEGMRFLSYMGGAVSMLSAMFIVFSTLSMGVTERSRTLAMLRAIGATRGQVATLVILEGMLLSMLGMVLGVGLGLLWVEILTTWKADFFSAGAVISTGGVVLGTVGSMLTALAASVLPAWSAGRVDPVEGMTAVGQASSAPFPKWVALAGLLLIAIDPSLMYLPGIPRPVVFWGHFLLGLPSLMVGYFLLAPAFVWIVEQVFGRPVAALMGVRHRLLAHQLTGHIWRAAGTAAALMVGLATLVVMYTLGNSVLNSWRLPTRFPDMFIYSPAGLTREQGKMLENVKGIRQGEVLPIAVTVSRLGDGFFAVVGAALLPDATMFLGVDPDKALSMMELDFRAGNAKDAAEKLKKGRHLIVTNEFKELKGLTVGSKMKLKTPKSGEVEYEIAGVVWSPGMDVFVSTFDAGRQFEQRSAASVFGSLEDAERDFGVKEIKLFAANLENFVDKQDLVKRVQEQLGVQGLTSGDVREIKANIDTGFRKLLLLVSTVAFAAIGVAALGVVNTIMASIRTRRWQLGVLRSVGISRGQMLRLILAEAILLGLVGCVLGVMGGLELSFDGVGLWRRMVGYTPPIDVPWPMVWLGMGIIVGVTVVASLWPAITAAREEPLALLQAGRAGV